jgi:hypothetical protein
VTLLGAAAAPPVHSQPAGRGSACCWRVEGVVGRVLRRLHLLLCWLHDPGVTKVPLCTSPVPGHLPATRPADGQWGHARTLCGGFRATKAGVRGNWFPGLQQQVAWFRASLADVQMSSIACTCCHYGAAGGAPNAGGAAGDEVVLQGVSGTQVCANFTHVWRCWNVARGLLGLRHRVDQQPPTCMEVAANRNTAGSSPRRLAGSRMNVW